jgi:hypothetical protein
VYELILTVMVTFVGPVAEVDGHGVKMLPQRYEVAVQGFSSEEECTSFAGYKSLESYLTSAFGTQTTVSPASEPHCRAQPAASTAKN